jgi:YVTN family beta-propeller protein
MRWFLGLGFSLTAVLPMLGGCSDKDTPLATLADSGATTDAVTDGLADGTVPLPEVSAQQIPNLGRQITPLAPPGARFEPLNPGFADDPDWLAGQAVTSVLSPDGKTLLVLTSGFNRVFGADGKLVPQKSTEYVFVYDVSTPRPLKKQVLQVQNAYSGIVFDPSGKAFYVPGNYNFLTEAGLGLDDMVHVYSLNASGAWAEGPGLPLHHKGVGVGMGERTDASVPVNAIVAVSSFPAGVAISSDGKSLVVANYYNDSITLFTGGLGAWSAGQELDLRPGKSGGESGVPGGEYPFWVAVKGSGASAVAYVSSIRDREIVLVSLNGVPAVTGRIPVKGQPGKMTLNAAQSLLYVVEDQSDTIDVIDTAKNAVIETIPIIAPAAALPAALAKLTGATPTSVTLSPDEKQLYVTNGNFNCVAVVDLPGTNTTDHTVGLIPTGWYPNSATFSRDGNTVYVVNAKSPTGANPGNCYVAGPSTHGDAAVTCLNQNQYNPQLVKAGFQSFTRPNAEQLALLTRQVAVNNHFASTETAHEAEVMAAVHKGIKHVIFIIKENRTYDQILGDLEVGNGDPDLSEFGEVLTPNQHNLARNFVTLDNFFDSAEVSYDGWPWTTSARAPDIIERQVPVVYASRGLSLDIETDRSVNTALPTLAERRAANPMHPNDPDLMPGQTHVSAPDGPDGERGTGYLWDYALRAGLKVRNYGFFVDTSCYVDASCLIPLATDPFSTKTVVAHPVSASLAPYTDPYFRGFDNAFPDYYRFKEWEREFDTKYQAGGEDLPALSLVRFMHDHTGNFAGASVGGGVVALDDVNTPELQQADNDYAVGLLIQKIASSKYANDTLIFVVEDDAQDGGDHVDSHRSIAFVAGAYVKQKAVVSTQYSTVDFVRTIQEVLGLPPSNLNDALARPMADVFNTTPAAWAFTAVPSPMLYPPNTKLPLPAKPTGLTVPKPTHDASYWARATKGMDFSSEDRFDFAAYNRILWTGLMGDKAYPAKRSGKDLRQNRKELLERYKRFLSQKPAR